jgi:hypothetical protein
VVITGICVKDKVIIHHTSLPLGLMLVFRRCCHQQIYVGVCLPKTSDPHLQGLNPVLCPQGVDGSNCL